MQLYINLVLEIEFARLHRIAPPTPLKPILNVVVTDGVRRQEHTRDLSRNYHKEWDVSHGASNRVRNEYSCGVTPKKGETEHLELLVFNSGFLQGVNNKKLRGFIKSLKALQPSSNARSNYTGAKPLFPKHFPNSRKITTPFSPVRVSDSGRFRFRFRLPQPRPIPIATATALCPPDSDSVIFFDRRFGRRFWSSSSTAVSGRPLRPRWFPYKSLDLSEDIVEDDEEEFIKGFSQSLTLSIQIELEKYRDNDSAVFEAMNIGLNKNLALK
ncbi:unnamed protein product [Vicia faba]|uniref:Uncharacterized protein n=1 Tax=Vicia faba TaxID=3906 RepID=A0AAV1AEB3_VICFA|nr:unnamed protein product [Vicia faba]